MPITAGIWDSLTNEQRVRLLGDLGFESYGKDGAFDIVKKDWAKLSKFVKGILLHTPAQAARDVMVDATIPGTLNKPAIFFGGILAAIALVLGISYWKLHRMINKGQIAIDLTGQVDSTLKQLIYNKGWLPKRIPVKPIFDTANKNRKEKATGIIAAISKYVSVKFEEK